jgi:RNA polymerase sigma factor (sigma-70 family)
VVRIRNTDPSDSPAAPLGAAPGSPNDKTNEAVEHFFRHEAARLHGALIRLLGPENMSMAEDVAQEALLRAFRTWSIGGFPANPSAWITRVAMNLARDAMRHRRMAYSKEDSIITHIEQTLSTEPTEAENDSRIRDDSLRLMFVCCHPSVAADAQVVLALKVLCGFSTGEIARAFMSTEAAIEKQLTRTKQRIGGAKIGFDIPEGENLAERLEGVHAALYLLFNEGHKASSGDKLIREELCREAIRLMSLLVEHPAGNTPRSHALLALMLLTAARFPSRIDEYGEILRLDDQDRSKWDQALIARGLFHLAHSASGNDVSEYHLQAGIAACHCLARDFASTEWARILRHYDDLLRLKPSPLIELNRAVAIAQLHGAQAGLDAVNTISQPERMDSHYLLHAVKGELNLRLGQHKAAAECFKRALKLATVGPEQAYLEKQLQKLER